MDIRPARTHGVTWAPGRLRLLARQPRVYLVLGAALVLITASTVYRAVADADQLKASYGRTAEVAVAHSDALPGDILGTRARVVELPRALVPHGAITAAAFNDAKDTSFSRTLRAGAVVTDFDLGSASVGLDDAAVVAVPVGAATPPLAAGQQVIVVLHQDAFSGQRGTLVTGAVYGVSESQVLVAVPMGQLQDVSAALGANGVTLALTGSG